MSRGKIIAFVLFMLFSTTIKFLNENYHGIKAAMSGTEQPAAFATVGVRNKPQRSPDADFDYRSASSRDRADWLKRIAAEFDTSIQRMTQRGTATRVITRAVPQAKLVRVVMTLPHDARDIIAESDALKSGIKQAICPKHLASVLSHHNIALQMVMEDQRGTRALDFKISNKTCNALRAS